MWSAVVRRCGALTTSSPKQSTLLCQPKKKVGNPPSNHHHHHQIIAIVPSRLVVGVPARRSRSGPARSFKLILHYPRQTQFFSSSTPFTFSSARSQPGCFVGYLAYSSVFVTRWRKLDRAGQLLKTSLPRLETLRAPGQLSISFLWRRLSRFDIALLTLIFFWLAPCLFFS